MKILLFISNLIILFSVFHEVMGQTSSAGTVHYMEPGDSVENSKAGLEIFCHNAKSKYLIHIWKTIMMNLHIDSDNYELYDGKSSTEVMDKHDINQRSWRFNWFGMKKNKHFHINLFEDTCIGVYTPHIKYKMSMISTVIDLMRVSLALSGLIIFWNGKKLSRNTLFYYVTGITLGVSFSILILIWFVSKFFGKGKTMYVMAGIGWAFSTLVLNSLKENAQLILQQYKEFVIWYLIITSAISFIICYRIGPITNSRTKHIIQWALQGSGLAMIYFSSHFHEASLSVCVLLIFAYNFPMIAFHRSKKYWKTMFPARQKLLTENEFRKQGIVETQKALGTLKEYCSSPHSNPWRMVLSLKDPKRFARFMEGDSHISEDESMHHDLELTKLIEECEYTDDEDY